MISFAWYHSHDIRSHDTCSNDINHDPYLTGSHIYRYFQNHHLLQTFDTQGPCWSVCIIRNVVGINLRFTYKKQLVTHLLLSRERTQWPIYIFIYFKTSSTNMLWFHSELGWAVCDRLNMSMKDKKYKITVQLQPCWRFWVCRWVCWGGGSIGCIGKCVDSVLGWHSSHFWVCITFGKVRHGDSVTKPELYH